MLTMLAIYCKWSGAVTYIFVEFIYYFVQMFVYSINLDMYLL